MQTIKKSDINKDQVGMEQQIPEAIQASKSFIKKDGSKKFYYERKQLLLETDMSTIRLGAGLQQARDGVEFSKEEAPDNSALWSKTFAGKSLTSNETHYSNIEREAVAILYYMTKRNSTTNALSMRLV